MPRRKKSKCKICGLRECLCSFVKKNFGKMKIRTKPTKCSKIQTIITGINPHPKESLNKIKSALGCGGFIQGKQIVLQGDHRQKFGNIAVKLGYSKKQVGRKFNISLSLLFFVLEI